MPVMQLWDELSRSGAKVFVFGASNRPEDLDAAIQRRFEQSLLIPIPDHSGRCEIFEKVLNNIELEEGFDIDRCAALTPNYTPSDIVSLCRSAAAIPMREGVMTHRSPSISGSRNSSSAGSHSAGNESHCALYDEPRISLRPLTIAVIILLLNLCKYIACTGTC